MKNNDELGALWIREKDGKVYMTGTIAGQDVVIFRNTYKKDGSREPDWRVLKSKPKMDRTTRREPEDDARF